VITPEELFDRCYEIATAATGIGVNERMHETLVLACAEGTRHTGQGFGNVFAQVDYLCKIHGMAATDKQAIQAMRRRSNHSQPLTPADRMYDVRALCLFISAVFGVSVPDRLVRIIPTENKPAEKGLKVNNRYVRCIVKEWDERFIYVAADAETGQLQVDYTNTEKGADLLYLRSILRKGQQLNLLDCHVEGTTVVPRLVVVEPDFLVDISSIAACFTDYGRHPLSFTVNRMRERANTQPILLGNFAGSALDDMIHNPGFEVNDTITNSFKEQALQFCACQQFDSRKFIQDAKEQACHLKEVGEVLFDRYDRSKAILEPSFICEQLGLQGRVDLMTSDFRLLVEQKSGKNIYIERSRQNPYHSFQREDHYVQLLLYYGILRYNFRLSDSRADIRLLYSKYPATAGLLVVNFYQQLFREAIAFRNLLVAQEYEFAEKGFEPAMSLLTPETLNRQGTESTFFTTYIRPQIEQVTKPLHQLSPLEHAYFCTMMTFVYREQLRAKVGAREQRGGCTADLWGMPLHEKKETGNIYTSLTLADRQCSSSHSGYDMLTLDVPEQGDGFLPNFRRGDMVYLYSYPPTEEPDVRRSILYRGTLQELEPRRIVVRLNNGQQNPDVFSGEAWAIEHGASDASTNSAIRGLHQLITAPQARRDLLLGQRCPQADTTRQLSRQYSAAYDEILLKAKQAHDYFLLSGPPGTGKTSMALRYIVEEELATGKQPSILLTAYTNRAVDEICSMLAEAGFQYLRLGSDTSCDPRFRSRLLDEVIQENPKMEQVRRRIQDTPIIVGTTSMLQAQPFIFDLKRFSLAVVDEASQILEPGIVGLLANHGADGSCRIGKFILIGDHKQLPAVVQQDEDESKVAHPLLLQIGLTDCRNSLFERLVHWEQLCGREQFRGVLCKQGRMHPDVADFSCRTFYAEEQLTAVPCAHQLATSLDYTLPSLDALDDLLKHRRVLFFPSAFCGGIATSAKANSDEARIVARLLTRIHRFYGAQFDADHTVGVIVPYRNQIAMIRREIEACGIPALQQISIDTVERYQGSQRDVIIYSFTVQYPYQLDFLTANSFEENGRVIDRKLNVAVTRARKQLLLTGNAGILARDARFRSLIERYGV
jgi:hypothetical protein